MTPTSRAIRALAAQAGLQEHWTDARQQPRQVAIDTLRRLLDAMGLACASEADIQASRARLRAPGHKGLVIGRAGEPLALPARAAGDCWLVPEDDATAARRVRPERAA
ncbi:4-alpha-glucanotransferase, partial [Bordetella hinzii]